MIREVGSMLKIEQLTVAVEDKEILYNVDLKKVIRRDQWTKRKS